MSPRPLRVAALAATALIAVPAAASAYTPPARALFGGGAIGPRFVLGNHSDVTWASARVANDRRSVSFYFDADTACGGQRIGVVLTNGTAPLRSGRFTGSSTIDPAANGGLAGTVAFSGRFTRSGLASGTARLTGTRNGASCAATAGTVHWQLRQPSAVRTDRKARPAGAFFGNTSQTYPVLLRTNAKGTRLQQAALELDYGCRNAKQRGLANETTPAAAISRSGAFHGVDRYASKYAEGFTGHWVSDLRGRVRNNRATGTWKVDLQVTRDSDGAVVDDCTTGPVKISAVS